MSLDQTNKLSSQPPEPAPEPVVAGNARRARAAAWPPPTAESLDTFATPSESTTAPEPVLTGPEPAVFGGVNPDEADAEELNEPLGTPLEEPMRGNELIPEAPQVEWGRLIRSTWFLLTSMILMLVGGSFIVWLTVPTETYVQTVIRYQRYNELDEREAAELQREMNRLLRSMPVRQEAVRILRLKSPGVSDGFLASGYVFDRIDAINWTPEGELRLRVDGRDPSGDLTRLSAMVEAFYAGMEGRHRRLADLKVDLAQLESTLAVLEQESAQLKEQIDALLPQAEQYSELVQASQALERYINQTDDSNPLKLVARLNLARVLEEAAAARKLSEERERLLNDRIATHKQSALTQEKIAALARSIEMFVFAEPPDPKMLSVHDTRGLQKAVMRGMWVAVILLFGGIMAALYLIDQRAAEEHRRQRRELLKTRKPEGRRAQATRNTPAPQ